MVDCIVSAEEYSVWDNVLKCIGGRVYDVGAATDTGKTKSGKIKRTFIGTWSSSKPNKQH